MICITHEILMVTGTMSQEREREREKVKITCLVKYTGEWRVESGTGLAMH